MFAAISKIINPATNEFDMVAAGIGIGSRASTCYLSEFMINEIHLTSIFLSWPSRTRTDIFTFNVKITDMSPKFIRTPFTHTVSLLTSLTTG
jgi:hypothetical protein